MSQDTTRENVRQHQQLGDLQDLLLKACPPARKSGRVSIPVLAAHLGITASYVYKWIEQNQVPPKYVRKIVDLSNGKVNIGDFHDYVFPA